MSSTDRVVIVAPRWWLSNFGGMVAFGLVAAKSRSRVLRGGFALAAATHVVETMYAYRAARRAGFERSAPLWAAQTLAVGFPSLLALRDARTPSIAVTATAYVGGGE